MIAIAVVLQPSKTMRICIMLFAVLLLSIGIYIACLDTLSALNQYASMVACFFAAWRIHLYYQQITKTSWHMSIDGHGQLRCRSESLQRISSSEVDSNPMKLVAGTTLWAHALFLRLYNPKEKRTLNLVVLPDALSKDEFRRLSVACRWIIARADAN